MKTALITGTSQRLGLYLCEALLDDGWCVQALTRRASEALRSLQRDTFRIHELGDYSDNSLRQFIDEYARTNQSLDLLVNNASLFRPDPDANENFVNFYQNLVFVHMTMPALLMQGLSKFLNGGNIVSITDIYADNPSPSHALYCSTKAGLQNLSLAFAKKLAPHVRVNCIQPGPIKFLPDDDNVFKDKILKETLVGTEGGFAPIYKALKFIVDDEYVTGSCVKVDGGRSLLRG